MDAVRTAADEIRFQMAKIRSELHREVRDVVGTAAAATKWRSYVRERPWMAIGVAFALGYLVVPRKARPVPALAVPVNGQTAVRVNGRTSPSQPAAREHSTGGFNVLRWGLGLIGPVAIRAAQSYAANAIENLLISQQVNSGPSGASRPDPAREDTPADRYSTRG